MLLNVAVFMWFGAVCPWRSFLHNDVIPIYRLIPLGILVLLLRRLPMILTFKKQIHQLEEWKHAAFTGWFGPIGVSAIFYLYISREFLREIEFEGHERVDAAKEMEILNVVVWFLCICSIVCHGLSVPLGKLGLYLPRTLSTAISSERASRAPSRSRSRPTSPNNGTDAPSPAQSFRRRRPATNEQGEGTPTHSPTVSWVSGMLLKTFDRSHRDAKIAASREGRGRAGMNDSTSRPEISAPQDARIIGRPVISAPQASKDQDSQKGSESPDANSEYHAQPSTPAFQNSESTGLTGNPAWQRRIRFPDEQKGGSS